MSLKTAFGVVLPTRGILYQKNSSRLDVVELSKLMDQHDCAAILAGDCILAKPRLDSIAVLSTAASVTEHVKLGAACVASFLATSDHACISMSNPGRPIGGQDPARWVGPRNKCDALPKKFFHASICFIRR